MIEELTLAELAALARSHHAHIQWLEARRLEIAGRPILAGHDAYLNGELLLYRAMRADAGHRYERLMEAEHVAEARHAAARVLVRQMRAEAEAAAYGMLSKAERDQLAL